MLNETLEKENCTSEYGFVVMHETYRSGSTVVVEIYIAEPTAMKRSRGRPLENNVVVK